MRAVISLISFSFILFGCNSHRACIENARNQNCETCEESPPPPAAPVAQKKENPIRDFFIKNPDVPQEEETHPVRDFFIKNPDAPQGESESCNES